MMGLQYCPDITDDDVDHGWLLVLDREGLLQALWLGSPFFGVLMRQWIIPLSFICSPRILSLVLSLVCLAAICFSSSLLANPPAIPLANVYREGIDLQDYWVSEKLDGVRAYWDGEQLWSRGGHVYAAPAWFTAGFPDHPLDGELWSGRERFTEISGVVRKRQPVDSEWQQLRFHVFDLPVPDTPFQQRYQQLKDLVVGVDSPYLALVHQRPIGSHAALMQQLDAIVADGAEGLMLKRKDGLYHPGRSDDLLKVKIVDDAEAVVVAHLPGRGRLEGMMGALKVELPDGRRFRIGTGFSDAERRTPPAPGTVVTFSYQGYTATGLPRFASFLRVRSDDLEAD